MVRGDLENKEIVGYTCSPTGSVRTLNYFLSDATKHKARFHQYYFIGALLKAKVENRIFVNLDIRYVDYFPEYANYFGRALILFKSMYGMTKSGKLSSNKLTKRLLEASLRVGRR